MSARVWWRRRTRHWYSGLAGSAYEKRYRHASRPGHGMGMGANTLIHNGRKP